MCTYSTASHDHEYRNSVAVGSCDSTGIWECSGRGSHL